MKRFGLGVPGLKHRRLKRRSVDQHPVAFHGKASQQDEAIQAEFRKKKTEKPKRPELDVLVPPVGAFEIRAKLRSRQAAHVAAGNSTANFKEMDDSVSRCQELNQLTWQWALKRVGYPVASVPDEFMDHVESKLLVARRNLRDDSSDAFSLFEKSATDMDAYIDVRKRYSDRGIPLTFGKDVKYFNGGKWIFWPMKYKPVSSKGKVQSIELSSPTMKFSTDFVIHAAAGINFCKLLSPLKAMEWLYVDSLRYRS